MRGRAVASTVTVFLVAVCSCGSGGGGHGGDGSLRGMLGALPASDEAVTVVYGDLARAAEIAGVEPPADVADEEAAADYLGTITGQRPQDEPAVAAVPLTLGQNVPPQELGELTDDVGWNPLQVDRFVEARYDGPIPSTVIDGRFDRGGFEQATEEAGDGVRTVGDPDGDLEDRTTPARRIGEPWWMSLDDDRMRIAGSAEEMDALVGASDGGGTLGDDDALTIVADALDGEDVYAAVLTNLLGDGAAVTSVLDADVDPEDLEALCDDTLPATPLVTGMGVADDDGPVVVISLLHAGAADAEANAEALDQLVRHGESIMRRQPWNERFEVERITTDGPVVVARLRLSEEEVALGSWYEVFYDRENLIASC